MNDARRGRRRGGVSEERGESATELTLFGTRLKLGAVRRSRAEGSRRKGVSGTGGRGLELTDWARGIRNWRQETDHGKEEGEW